MLSYIVTSNTEFSLSSSLCSSLGFVLVVPHLVRRHVVLQRLDQILRVDLRPSASSSSQVHGPAVSHHAGRVLQELLPERRDLRLVCLVALQRLADLVEVSRNGLKIRLVGLGGVQGGLQVVDDRLELGLELGVDLRRFEARSGRAKRAVLECCLLSRVEQGLV